MPCKAFGSPDALTVEDVPSSEPQDGQVVIAVHAAAVNVPDTLTVQDKYPFKPALTFSLGSALQADAPGPLNALRLDGLDLRFGTRGQARIEAPTPFVVGAGGKTPL